MKKMEDRRTKRSKRMLKQGLIQLMHEKKFKDISVRDITDRIDMNRGTFYLHYTDTYDLLQKMETEVLSDVQEMIDAHRPEIEQGTLKPVMEPILDYIVENKELCATMFANGAGGTFMRRMQEMIYRNGAELIHRRFTEVSEEKIAYLTSFISYGLIGLIKEWFDTDMAMSKKTLTEMADAMLNALAERLFQPKCPE